MNHCKEFVLDDLMAITAIPISDVSAGDTDSPVNKLTPTIPEEDFDIPVDNAIVIGLQAATAGGVIVPIKRTSGKAKDDESDSVAGRLHSVSVNCEVDERGGEIWAPIAAMDNTPCSQRLERTPHHLVLSFRGGTKGFVAATEDAYLCTIERDGGKVSIAFNIQCLMGIQLIV